MIDICRSWHVLYINNKTKAPLVAPSGSNIHSTEQTSSHYISRGSNGAERVCAEGGTRGKTMESPQSRGFIILRA